MGRRARRRQREPGSVPSTSTAQAASTTDYRDAEGNVLTLRDDLSPGTIERFRGLESRASASADDMWQRRMEFLFERLAVRWEIAGLPLERQSELLGRYRMADEGLRRWVRETVVAHTRERLPELGL